MDTVIDDDADTSAGRRIEDYALIGNTLTGPSKAGCPFLERGNTGAG